VQEVAMYSNGTYQTWTSGGATLTIPATAGMWIECGSAATWTPS
jgi:hypothetical protein